MQYILEQGACHGTVFNSCHTSFAAKKNPLTEIQEGELYLCLEHQKYLEWNGDRFRKWADSIGINTSKVVDAILTSGRMEQQSYRSCMGLLKLAEKYSPEKLEQVCAKALSYSGKPSYKSIKNLLAATKDVPGNEPEKSQAVKPHGITRGARYYGGKQS